jgi:hypothetical protein
MTFGRRRLVLLAALVSIVGHEVALSLGNDPMARLSGSLRATEHGPGWLITVVTVAFAAVAALVIAAWRINSLRRRLLAASSAVPWSVAPARADVLRAWLRIFTLAILAFLLQENLEHLLVHGHAPLFEPLVAGQYVATLPIFAALALLSAATSLRLGRRIDHLAAAVLAAARHATRAPRRVSRPSARLDDLRVTWRRTTGLVVRRAPPIAVPF